jgi:SAM-dependent methyltransferase
VAEIGAGIGNFSSLLLKKGVKQLVAFEPSENMYHRLEQRLAVYPGVEVIQGFFKDSLSEYKGYFDSVVYVNVLEHVEDDKEEMSCVVSSLKKNGFVCIFVPALSWLYSHLDKKLNHYRRYHKKDIIRLFQGAGLEIVKVRYFDFLGIFPWYIKFTLLKQSMKSGNVQLYDKMVVPVMRCLESIITPPIGKNILAVAQKI